MEDIFESYLEVENIMQNVRVCSSGDCDSFVSDYIFLRIWQDGEKVSSYVEL